MANKQYIKYVPWKIFLIWIHTYTGKSKRMDELTWYTWKVNIPLSNVLIHFPYDLEQHSLYQQEFYSKASKSM